MTIPNRLVTSLESEAGDSLRSVATYSEDGYDLHYIRDDVRTAYTDDDMDAVFDDLLLDNMNREFLERLFNAGRLECNVLGFEEAVMLHFTGEVYSGLFVSIDRVPDVQVLSLVDTCKEVLPS